MEESGDVQKHIIEALRTWARRDGLYVHDIEHGIDYGGLNHHEFWICIPPLTVMNRLVVWHPQICRCDALPDEVVLHG